MTKPQDWQNLGLPRDHGLSWLYIFRGHGNWVP